MKQEELLIHFEEMWESATIGDTWKLNKGMIEAHDQIVKLIEDSDKPFKKLKEMGFKVVYESENSGEQVDELINESAKKIYNKFKHGKGYWYIELVQMLEELITTITGRKLND